MIKVFVFLSFALISTASASVIKTTTIEGQEYSCRPSNIETPCTLKTDFAFILSMAADSADAVICLNDTGNDPIKIKDCFLQRRIKSYAKDLDVQMSSRSCWMFFLETCTKIEKCESGDSEKKCGFLGSFLYNVRRSGLSHLFNENDGVSLCQSLVE